MDVTLLRNNLANYLTGEAERWYTEELSEITRIGLQNATIDHWCSMLEERFRDPPNKAFTALEPER